MKLGPAHCGAATTLIQPMLNVRRSPRLRWNAHSLCEWAGPSTATRIGVWCGALHAAYTLDPFCYMHHCVQLAPQVLHAPCWFQRPCTQRTPGLAHLSTVCRAGPAACSMKLAWGMYSMQHRTDRPRVLALRPEWHLMAHMPHVYLLCRMQHVPAGPPCAPYEVGTSPGPGPTASFSLDM